MDDEMDVFLSRCLKNWAAHQSPSKDGRERLLSAAAQLAQEGQADSVPPVKVNPVRELTHAFIENVEYDPGLSKLWPIFMLSTLRLTPCGSSDLKYGTFSSISSNVALIYLLHS
jgi:hypothetical protein